MFTSDCTAAYSDEDHECTLRNMRRYFGQVVTADEVAGCWKAVPTQAAVS